MAQCRSALRAIGIVLVAFVGTGAGFQPSALPFAGLLAGPSHMHSLRLACGHDAMQNSARLHKNGASRPLEVRMEASSPQAADGRLSTPEVAVVGGGCFWCTEAIFLEAAGVLSVTPGYAGGSTGNPTYKQVVSGKTGHAEVGVT